MAQVIELFPKATHSPNALDVQRYVEKFLMTRGCPFHRGQKTRLFQEPEKLNMKSTFLGNMHYFLQWFWKPSNFTSSSSEINGISEIILYSLSFYSNMYYTSALIILSFPSVDSSIIICWFM